MIPFAGYIKRRVRVASRLGANIGAFAFGNGVIWLILAALIVSQHHHANSMGNVTVAVGFLRFHFLSPTPTKFLPGISPPRP